MEQQDVRQKTETERGTSVGASSSKMWSVCAALFYVAAAALIIVAFVVAYADSSYDNKVVGGDAYNYIIFAGRGVVWGTAAIVSALFGAGCQNAGRSR